MIKNYFKIAWRNLWKHKLFSLINIFGLALSLSVCLLVMVQLQKDFSFDLFHPYPDRTFRILSEIEQTSDNQDYVLASSPLPLKTELLQFKDQVEDAVQIYPAINEKALYERKSLPLKAAFTDPSFFNVFGFKLSQGNQETALQISNSIVISAETSKRFFGDADPIGRILEFQNLGLFEVTGVLAETDQQSHLDFDAYVSALAIPQLEKSNLLSNKEQDWNTFNEAYTYVLLSENSSKPDLEKLLAQVAEKPELISDETKISFKAQKLSSITPGTDAVKNEIGKGTVWAKVWTILGVGLIILLAACFNYTNLNLARALTRAKEIGVRKVTGASRFQIFTQYIVESVLIAVLALVFAIIGYLLYDPILKTQFILIGIALLFTIIIGIGAGAFPAWILSSFRPVDVLKSLSTQKLFGNLSLKKGLLVFQFSLSLVIIVFLSAYYQQFTYVDKLDPGFASENILSIPMSGEDMVFANEISKLKGVKSISRTSEDFGMRGSGYVELYTERSSDQDKGLRAESYFIDDQIILVHELEILAGSNFSITDASAREKNILINEKLVNLLGYVNNSEAIGNSYYINDSTQVSIKGVVKDFYDKGASRYIMPLVLRNQVSGFNYLNVLVEATQKEALISLISSEWKKLNPNSPLEYQWLDKKIAAREDQGEAYTIMGFLAFITISIATIGLLGLVIYTVETRQKEISVRKIIGASVNQIMRLLSKGFLKLLLISGLIALPIGYLASLLFLQNFANKVSFGIGSLIACFLFLLIIGLLTILSNTYRAATANPADNIRTD
ncbi:putative ABC transport system permease protein [Flavobacteriaceae bacterium MAR_2010_188]|nr:putative ABC transport system permease protein [Flavobacteriaceae bacterium MAR_2010_188]